MSTARRTRWAGVLVSDRGRAVLLRSHVGSVVFPSPEAATPPASVPFLYSDDTPVLYSDDTPVEYA
jgi:hypothetical protein